MAAWDRVKASLFALVGPANPRADYAGIFAGTVVSQSGDTVDLAMDDQVLPGFSRLPITVGLPGSRVTFAPGARMFVFFENRDPSKPRAIGWDAASGASVLSMTIGGGGAAPLSENMRGTEYRQAEKVFLQALQTYAAAIKGKADPTGVATAALTAAIVAFGVPADAVALSKIVKTA